MIMDLHENVMCHALALVSFPVPWEYPQIQHPAILKSLPFDLPNLLFGQCLHVQIVTTKITTATTADDGSRMRISSFVSGTNVSMSLS
jgi:hypothetical protein